MNGACGLFKHYIPIISPIRQHQHCLAKTMLWGRIVPTQSPLNAMKNHYQPLLINANQY
jgi:hypothetical protein